VQAKKLLNEKYAKYFTDPSIVLQIMNQRPVRIYVTGAVANPGVYISGKNTASEHGSNEALGDVGSALFYRMYLADSLIIAGGLNYNANVGNILIHRTFPQPMTIHVNLWDLFQNGNLIQDIPVRDQDVIEVLEIPDDQLVMNEQWEELTHTNLSENRFKISVLGAVKQPGSFMVKTEDTILTAVTQAGGFSDLADHKNVYVLRTLSNGQVVKRQLNLNDKALIGKKPFEQWARLMPNDVVYVDESGGKKAVNLAEGIATRATGAAILPILNRVLDFNK
jgi:polysaccharide export outer membrane protein